MEPAAPKNVRDRHDLPALQESSSPHRLIKTEDTIKKILASMGLPTEAPKPYPARPPPSEPGEGGDYLN
jgi:hypothetical protein